MPVNKSEIDHQFTTHVLSLQQASGVLGAAIDGEQRIHTPPPGLTGDPANPLQNAFDRSTIGQAYELVLFDSSNPGNLADVAALKLQNDVIACRETAFRSSHASAVRCAVHAAARRKGHASPAGVLGNGVLRYVQDVLLQGGNEG